MFGCINASGLNSTSSGFRCRVLGEYSIKCHQVLLHLFLGGAPLKTSQPYGKCQCFSPDKKTLLSYWTGEIYPCYGIWASWLRVGSSSSNVCVDKTAQATQVQLPKDITLAQFFHSLVFPMNLVFPIDSSVFFFLTGGDCLFVATSQIKNAKYIKYPSGIILMSFCI